VASPNPNFTALADAEQRIENGLREAIFGAIETREYELAQQLATFAQMAQEKKQTFIESANAEPEMVARWRGEWL
jgi:hypothetical protein